MGRPPGYNNAKRNNRRLNQQPLQHGRPSPYDEGDRVELVHTTDEHTNLEPGTRGTVTNVDALGTVFVDWDDGSSLGMVPGEDEIRRVNEEDAS